MNSMFWTACFVVLILVACLVLKPMKGSRRIRLLRFSLVVSLVFAVVLLALWPLSYVRPGLVAMELGPLSVPSPWPLCYLWPGWPGRIGPTTQHVQLQQGEGRVAFVFVANGTSSPCPGEVKYLGPWSLRWIEFESGNTAGERWVGGYMICPHWVLVLFFSTGPFLWLYCRLRRIGRSFR